MMKTFAISASLMISLSGFGQTADGGAYSIKGNIKGLADKSQVFLTDPDKPEDTLARTVSKQQRFELKGTLPATKLYQINFIPGGKKGLLFLDASNITLEGDLAAIQNLQVKGSATHSGFKEFQQTFEPYFKQFAALTEAANKSGVNDSLMTQYKALTGQIVTTAESFGAAHKEQYVAPFAWATIFQIADDPIRIEKSLTTFSPAVQESFYGKFLKNMIADGKIGRVGTPALEFSQADTTGKQVSLSSFRGKYVLVDFWASWCGPCRQENPNLVAAHDKFKAKNFTVLGVSLDNNRDKWLKAIAADNLHWTQVSDLKYWQNEVALQYKVQSIPRNILIDPNGVIIAKDLRGEELQDRLCKLLGCN